MLKETRLCGLNCRNLQSLSGDRSRFSSLVDIMPADRIRVAGSGLAAPEDAAKVARLGYPMALIGSALMKSDDPGALLVKLIAAGRGAC